MARKNYRKKRTKRSRKRKPSLSSLSLSQSDCYKFSVLNIARQSDFTPHTFVRFADNDVGILSSRTTSTTSQAITFKLDRVQNYSEFSNLYEQYRIVKIHMTFTPRIQLINQLVGSTLENQFRIPRIYLTRDYDSATGLTIDQMKQRPDVRMYQATKRFTYITVPQIADAIYNDGITTAYSTPFKTQWVDCANVSVTHFGFKYLIEGSQNSTPGSGPEFGYDVSIKYLIQFKGVR